ncbi:MAG: DUF2231 domain-containing protein, partial [Prochlorococcus sp.]|nr:hypothetical protein [Prochlorococcaceae cyanobacterium ETNP18_MAG_1]
MTNSFLDGIEQLLNQTTHHFLLSTSNFQIEELSGSLGANNLPYSLPIHPNLVHFTIGLFAIGIAFDFAGALYPLEKRIFRFLALPVTR